MPFLILLLTGLFVIALGIVVIVSVPREEAFTKIDAVLVRYVVGNRMNHVKPVVKYELEGVTGQHTCWEIPTKYADDQPGDTVQVYYHQKSFLGLKGLNTVADKPNSLRNFLRRKKAAGIFLVTIGIVFGIIALAIA